VVTDSAFAAARRTAVECSRLGVVVVVRTFGRHLLPMPLHDAGHTAQTVVVAIQAVELLFAPLSPTSTLISPFGHRSQLPHAG
jgi:hypothetical protein